MSTGGVSNELRLALQKIRKMSFNKKELDSLSMEKLRQLIAELNLLSHNALKAKAPRAFMSEISSVEHALFTNRATRIDVAVDMPDAVATFTETDINTYLDRDWTDENDKIYFEHVYANYTADGLEHLSGSDFCSDEQDFQMGEEN